MKSIYNVLSNLYTNNTVNNYTAYEIRLQLGDDPGKVILCWSNFEDSLMNTETVLGAEELPNWVIRMLHKYPFLWAAECDNDGFCCQAGVFVDTPTEWGYKMLEW